MLSRRSATIKRLERINHPSCIGLLSVDYWTTHMAYPSRLLFYIFICFCNPQQCVKFDIGSACLCSTWCKEPCGAWRRKHLRMAGPIPQATPVWVFQHRALVGVRCWDADYPISHGWRQLHDSWFETHWSTFSLRNTRSISYIFPLRNSLIHATTGLNSPVFEVHEQQRDILNKRIEAPDSGRVQHEIKIRKVRSEIAEIWNSESSKQLRKFSKCLRILTKYP
jgi:hypothetical protein